MSVGVDLPDSSAFKNTTSSKLPVINTICIYEFLVNKLLKMSISRNLHNMIRRKIVWTEENTERDNSAQLHWTRITIMYLCRILLSTSVQMTQNGKKPLIHQRSMLLTRGTSKSWRNRLTRSSSSSGTGSAKS